MHRLLSKVKPPVEEPRRGPEPRHRNTTASNGASQRRPRRVLNEAAHKLSR